MNLLKKPSLILQSKIPFLTVLFLLPTLAMASQSLASDDTSPMTNKGRKWRIGYYEGGPFTNYPPNLRALVKALGEMGWIDKTDIPSGAQWGSDSPSDQENGSLHHQDSVNIWRWLARNVNSPYLEFVEDACWSAGWDDNRRKRNRADAITRLKKGNLDLMIAMGTWAGLDLANNEHSVPTLVMSTSDPVQSGIIRSAEDSGFDHVHARCDPARYLRQVRLFHSIINFKKLGVVFENTPEGRSYAALQDIEKVAQERDFEIISCQAPFSGVDQVTAMNKMALCWEKLAPQIDALYVTVHRGVILDRLPEIMTPLMKQKIPTFSQRGTEEVKYGVLYCVDRESFDPLGRFYAQTIARIFHGTRPRWAEQVFSGPKKIVVNLNTANIIEYTVPPNILKVADIVYGLEENIP